MHRALWRGERERSGSSWAACTTCGFRRRHSTRWRSSGGTASGSSSRRNRSAADHPLSGPGRLEYLDTLKSRNIEASVFRNIDTVMTMCAGCGSTLKNDYKTPFRVMDINEVLTRYGIEPPARLPIKAVYHDPCHLLRGQGIKNQPRELITQVVDLVEMPSVCCGSGGGVRSGVPEEAAALGREPAEGDREDRRRHRDHLLPVLRVSYPGAHRPAGEEHRHRSPRRLPGERQERRPSRALLRFFCYF